MAIARWDEVRTGPLGERMIRFLERYPKADEIYITSAKDGDHGEVSHHYGLWYEGSRTAAIDIGAGGLTPAGSAKMRDVARWLYDNFADYTVELIHTTPYANDDGFYVKNQRRYPGGAIYGEPTKSEHRNHVHWATSADLMTAMEQGAGPSPLERLAIPNTTPVWGWDASDWDWSGDRERIAIGIDRILVPSTRALDTTTTEGITVSLNASEQRELLQLLRDLAPMTRRLEELLARSGEDGGGGIGTRSLDAGQPSSAGPAGGDYWGIGYSGGPGTRSLDAIRQLDPVSIHSLRGRYISGPRTQAVTPGELPRTRGIDVAPGALRALEPINPGPPVDRAMKIADVTGPGLTDRFGMAATDLGVMTRTPSGRILAVFGDTFRDAWVGSADWRGTVGLISDTKNLDEGLVWSEAAGRNRNYAMQLWDYPHLPCPGGASTVLPSDVMTVGNTIYLHTTAHFPFGNVTFGEIWKSTDEGRTWFLHGPRLDTGLHGGLAQLWTWDLGDDGFVYIMSTGFRIARDQPVILRRVPADRIGDPGAYQGWGFGPGGWAWGNEPTPVLDGGYGELCLRRIDGQWVLVAFNAGAYRLDVKVFPDFENCDLNTWPTSSPIFGGDWGQERDDSVAQLYGPSIIPGSRPGSGFHLLLSQWRSPGSWPYHVMQFKVPMPGIGGPRGLEPTREAAPRKAPAKTAPRKAPPAKKAPVKKVSAKKTPARKAPAKRSPRKATGNS